MNLEFAKRMVVFSIVMIMTTIESVSGTSTPSTTIEDNVAEIQWDKCTEPDLSETETECGFLSVPLDYARPNGMKIQLAVSRVKHTVSDGEYQGVILLNPGGPGGSGLGLAVIRQGLPDAVSNTYDWIGFDPRGVGASKPAITCDPNYLAGPRPDYTPSNQTLEDIWLNRSKGYATACAKNNAKLLAHMTTIDVVKDMDRLRIALGQEKINYYGFSYGTYLGQLYATLYSNRVRRMVLDSNIDPRTVWFQANLDQDIGFDRNIRIWFRWLAKYHSVYHLGNIECQVEERWNSVLKQLETNPANGTVGPDEWLDGFLLAAYFQPLWPMLGDAFAQWANEQNFDLLLQVYENANTPGDDNGFAVYLAVTCTDTQWPQNWEFVRTENWRTFSKAPIFTWDNTWFNGPCQYWSPKAGTLVNVDGKNAPPILLIDETLDAPTAFAGSMEIRRLFPSSILIAVLGGTTHANSLNGNQCVDDPIAEYLRSGKLPLRKYGDVADVECAPLPEPVPSTLLKQSETKTTVRDKIHKHCYHCRRRPRRRHH